MGTLFYGQRTDITFDDRTLFHLQIVMSAKLRRGESFFFTWKEDVATGSGRGSIWIQRSIPLVFALRTSRPFAVNRRWLEQLTQSANSAQGLVLSEEPPADVDAPTDQGRRHESEPHGHSTRSTRGAQSSDGGGHGTGSAIAGSENSANSSTRAPSPRIDRAPTPVPSGFR